MRIGTAVRCLLAVLALSIAPHARASLVTFDGLMSGAAESPVNASPGTGFVIVDFDTVLRTMRVRATFSGLLGNTTASHIHCCTALPGVGTAGVATTTPSFPGFPLGVTAGTFDMTYDMNLVSSYNAPFVAANGGTAPLAGVALLNGMLAGDTYFNIHTSAFGGGEIRAFLRAQAVPEPWTVALLGIGVMLGVAHRGRSRGASVPNTLARLG